MNARFSFGAVATPGTGRMARVLVVDDHEIFLQGLVLLLDRDERLEVVGTATNGADAVRLAEELRPDVVLLDVVMPGMDGYEAAGALRERARRRRSSSSRASTRRRSPPRDRGRAPRS